MADAAATVKENTKFLKESEKFKKAEKDSSEELTRSPGN